MNCSALHPLLTVLMLVSMCAARVAAQAIGEVNNDLNATERLRLILIVNDQVDLPAPLLQDAREAAATIFRHAGIDIVWFTARGAIPEEPVAVGEWELRNAQYVVRISTSAAGRSPSSALGFTAHSIGGLMRATLDLVFAARGVLLFTDTEEETIRASLSPRQ